MRLARIAFALALLLLAARPALAASEIGYVEDFTGEASSYVIRRDGQELPVVLCMPLMQGDRLIVAGKGRALLRLADRPDPVVWTAADSGTALDAPGEPFWSPLLDWVVAKISPIDTQRRERVAANIRDDGGGEFGVPLLSGRQIIAAGERTLAIGWQKPVSPVQITITPRKRKPLVQRAKGVGGLWVSEPILLKPGVYRIEVSTPSQTVRGEIEAVDAGSLPAPPPELARIPGPLSAAASAIWLAGQNNGRFRLEAFQRVAGKASAGPVTAVRGALIDGAEIPAPP
jgi:hypothetical protein